jgi:hypothetical protein
MRSTGWFLPLILAVVLFAGAVACSSTAGPVASTQRATDDDDDNDDATPDDDDNDNDNDNDDTSPDDDDSSPDDDASPDDDSSPDDDLSPDDDDDNDVSPADDDTSNPTVWTDPSTHLMWQNGNQVGTQALTWADAASYCANLTWGGYSGWRLPDIDALRSLIQGCVATGTGGACGGTDGCADETCWNVACQGCSSVGGPGPDGAYWSSALAGNYVAWYWSSTAPSGDSDAWDVSFEYGWVKTDAVSFADGVRCVRGSDDDDDDDNDDNDDNDTAGETVWTDPTSGLMWQNGAAVGVNAVAWAEADSYCASLSWAGQSGWRLPDIDALRGLLRGCTETDTGGACGVTDDCLADDCWSFNCYGCDELQGPGPGGAYWPSEISGVDADWYWSSSPSGDPGWAFGVYFDSGRVMDYYDTTDGGVRCVRTPGDDDSSPDDDDTSPTDDDDDNDDDTTNDTVWTDPSTGLSWQNGTNVGQIGYSWAAAQTFCTNLKLGGYTDWRLPDIDTLRTLLQGCAATDPGSSCGATDGCLLESCWNVACDGCPNLAGPGGGGAYWSTDVLGSAGWYWSSSATADGDSKAWDIHFSNGHINYDAETNLDGARCVRGGDDDDDNDDNDDDDTTESVWTDPTTDLMWQNGGAVGSDLYAWADAENYCETLTWDGYGTWELPTIDQLRTLIGNCAGTETGGTCSVTDACLTDNCWTIACYGCDYQQGAGPGGAYWPAELSGNDIVWYWSSSAAVDQGYAFGVYFDYGRLIDYTDSTGGGARCVRASVKRQ